MPDVYKRQPEGMDSAVVGYVIDGSVDDKDVMSLKMCIRDRYSSNW